jgi:hypothetical protein
MREQLDEKALWTVNVSSTCKDVRVKGNDAGGWAGVAALAGAGRGSAGRMMDMIVMTSLLAALVYRTIQAGSVG